MNSKITINRTGVSAAAMFIVALSFAATPRASARLGETIQECAARYGEPVNVTQEGTHFYFQKGDMLINAVFYEGKCELLGFSKSKMNAKGPAKKMTEDEIEMLLKANSGGSKWKIATSNSTLRLWTTEDELLWAGYAFEDHSLVLYTDAAGNRARQEEKNSTKSKLQDF